VAVVGGAVGLDHGLGKRVGGRGSVGAAARTEVVGAGVGAAVGLAAATKTCSELPIATAAPRVRVTTTAMRRPLSNGSSHSRVPLVAFTPLLAFCRGLMLPATVPTNGAAFDGEDKTKGRSYPLLALHPQATTLHLDEGFDQR
jgi:hypothetical protein